MAKMLKSLHHLLLPKTLLTILFFTLFAFSLGVSFFLFKGQQNLNTNLASFQKLKSTLEDKVTDAETELSFLKNQDQLKRNEELNKEILNIQKTYQKALTSYEKILDLKDSKVNTSRMDKQYAQILDYLSQRNYASAEGTLVNLEKDLAPKVSPPSPQSASSPIPSDNNPPASGYKRQVVKISSGTFSVDIISADLSSTKVVVDTASESDCGNNCPVLSLGDFVSRNGAYAGINGSFFCPATYPSCAGKTNSFDTLLMNKNKKYFNSDNNVYSVIPAVIFGNGWIRFVSKSQEWGRDTSIDSMIANYPLLLAGGNSQFRGSSDPKITNKGTRNFIGAKGNTVYIGSVHNVTTAEEAEVLKALGIQDALGLDQGGSTALWHGGYKLGPGRGIPNAILFIKR